jgi:methionine-rich copper-binding protein CopC
MVSAVLSLVGGADLMKNCVAHLVSAALFALSASPAFPHSTLIRSNPQADAVLQTAPREVAIFFSERVQPARSSIVVEDASGARVDNGESSVDANGRVLRVGLKNLSAGTYNVTWRTRSTDTHNSEGRFSFQVRQ